MSETKEQISRTEKRFRERLQNEAKETHIKLAEKFFNFFTLSDNPEGPQVQEKMKEVDAQWRVYCKRRGLSETAYPVMREYMQGVLKDYQEAKQ